MNKHDEEMLQLLRQFADQYDDVEICEYRSRNTHGAKYPAIETDNALATISKLTQFAIETNRKHLCGKIQGASLRVYGFSSTIYWTNLPYCDGSGHSDDKCLSGEDGDGYE